MSGGPVFSEEGYLCGIICSNLPPGPDNKNGDHTSYIATLWPSMGIKVTFYRQGHPRETVYRAIELARGGFLHVVDLDKVSIAYDVGGTDFIGVAT